MTVDGMLRSRIRLLANERGMSLPDLERALGFGSGTIVKWDKSMPNTDKLLIVSDFLEVSLDYLVRGYDFKPKEPEAEVEKTILKLFRKLNPHGQEKLIDYAGDLVSSGNYIFQASCTVDH